MNNRKLIRWGITGTIITMICCFTPALVFLFSAIGLSAIVGYLDIVLLPTLAIFVAMTVYGYWKMNKS